ncbi:MAG: HD domain-containing protein [Deltaproteobacteria bacterium]|nr:HD domain-containing protein [Deltaproteobacteria bacterium]
MTQEEQDSLQRWFEHYTDQFRDQDGVLRPLLELKRCHSLRVAGNARFIADALKFSESERRLAETAGLVHDVGRFTQFVRYGSFRDSDTVDHGAEGRRVLEEQGQSFLPDPENRELLLCVVEYHNRKRTDIPCGLSPEKNRFLSLIRDADKLDIMELVLRAVVNDGFQDLREMLPHIRLSRELSTGVLAEAVKTGSVSNGHLATLSDFIVMMATWYYDMNYPPTRQLAVKRGILHRIRCELPDTKPVRELFAGILALQKSC